MVVVMIKELKTQRSNRWNSIVVLAPLALAGCISTQPSDALSVRSAIPAPAIEQVGRLAIVAPGAERERREPRTNAAAEVTEYRGGWWWDDSSGSPRFVQRSRFSSDGVFVDRASDPTRVIDFSGRYIIPALADGHDHFIEGPWALDYMRA